jgi:hypothetical protein
VMLVATAPMAIGTSPAKPYKTFTDVIKAAKARPDTLTLGSVGSGSLGHLTLMLVQQAGGFRLVHVPYKGGGPMTVDIMGGHLETGIGSTGLMAPLINGGKIRGVAVTGNKRSQALPDLPTLAEQASRALGARLVGHLHAGGGAAASRRQDARGARQSLQPAGRAQAAHRDDGHGARGEHARRAAEIPGGRDGALGQGRA